MHQPGLCTTALRIRIERLEQALDDAYMALLSAAGELRKAGRKHYAMLVEADAMKAHHRLHQKVLPEDIHREEAKMAGRGGVMEDVQTSVLSEVVTSLLEEHGLTRFDPPLVLNEMYAKEVSPGDEGKMPSMTLDVRKLELRNLAELELICDNAKKGTQPEYFEERQKVGVSQMFPGPLLKQLLTRLLEDRLERKNP